MKIIKSKNNFKDYRGSIADIFYNKNIKHISMIISNKNVIRGNLYLRIIHSIFIILVTLLNIGIKNTTLKANPKKFL